MEIKKCRLKVYAKKVWDLINTFESFNIIFIPRGKNHRANYLIVSTSMLILDGTSDENYFLVKNLFHPAIPNNEDSLQVFDNDEKILTNLASSEREENYYQNWDSPRLEKTQ